MAASYVLFPIHERASSCKLLQLMTGLHPALFWTASFIYDFASHLCSTVLIVIVFAIFDKFGIFTGYFLNTSKTRTVLSLHA